MTQINIPASLDEAIASLNGIDGLLTAKEWERAAIVYAFTTEGTPGPKPSGDLTTSSQISSISDFAAKGIKGLASRDTVRRYRNTWQTAIDASKAGDVFPGNEVTLPDLPWGEVYVSERREEGRTADGGSIELPQTKDPEKLREHFEQHPASAQRVTQALTSTPEGAQQTYKAARKAMVNQARTEPPPPKTDPRQERNIRIEAIADEVIRGLAELLDPDTDPLGQRLGFLEQNLDALSPQYRQRLTRAIIELGARVGTWEDRVRGLSGHTVAS